MYAALIPEMIRQTIVPNAHRNILTSPSFSLETFSALRKQRIPPTSVEIEIVPKEINNMRSSFGMVWANVEWQYTNLEGKRTC